MNKNEISEEKSFVCTPWDTSGKIDYMKLVKQFGTEIIDQTLLDKFQRITGKDLHPWLRRGIFFTHRGLSQFLDAYENGDPVFLYTGRGPSSEAMHIGHLIPFLFTQWLQEIFNCPLIIQISDEEKAAFKKIPFEVLYKMGFENAKEIISCGFNPEKTFIFSNRDYRMEVKAFESFASDMKMCVPIKVIQSIFGLGDSSTIAMYDWPIYQSAAAFYQSYPHIFGNRPAYCLVPYAIDQDPYFRLARDISSKMNLIKPCSIMCTFIPPLTGTDGKMSSSTGSSTLFLTDNEETFQKKIMTLCASGGDSDPEVHRAKGGNPNIDIAYQYLRYFEYDDTKLMQIYNTFQTGELGCDEIKQILVSKISEIMKRIQENRAKITDDYLKSFYEMKPMELPKPKSKTIEESEGKLYDLLKGLDIEYRTKYHPKITTKDEAEELSLSLEGTICKVLLLKAKEGYILYAINSHTNVNMKALPKKIDTKTLRFAESDTYTQILKVNSKTCPTLFAIMNDSEKLIKTVLIDLNIPKDKPVNFFAMREDGTTTIAYEDMIKFIEYHKYPLKYVQE